MKTISSDINIEKDKTVNPEVTEDSLKGIWQDPGRILALIDLMTMDRDDIPS